MANVFDELLDRIRNKNAPPSVFGPRGAPWPESSPLFDPARVARYQQPSPNIASVFAKDSTTENLPPLVDVPSREDEALADSPPLVDVPSAEDAALAESPALVDVPLPPKTQSYEQTKRSTARDSKKGPAKKASDPALLASTATSAEPKEDALLKKYGAKADELGKSRTVALEKALAEKDLSTEEKVAVALLAALPGLVGAIGGGAIAGGWGAAAGAAGGLKGGAEGVQAIAQSKEARRKEAKGDAATLGEQVAQQEGLATRRQEMLEGRELDAKKTADQRAFEMDVLQKREAGDNSRAAMQRRAQLEAAMIGAQSHDYAAQLGLQEAQAKAAAAGKADNAPEHESKAAAYATRMLQASRQIADAEKTGFDRASMMGALNARGPNVLASSPAQIYESAEKAWLAGLLRKDSGAAITDEEWKTFGPVYFPRHGDSDATKAAKQRARAQEEQSMIAASGRAQGRIFAPTGAESGGNQQAPASTDWRSAPGITWNQ